MASEKSKVALALFIILVIYSSLNTCAANECYNDCIKNDCAGRWIPVFCRSGCFVGCAGDLRGRLFFLFVYILCSVVLLASMVYYIIYSFIQDTV